MRKRQKKYLKSEKKDKEKINKKREKEKKFIKNDPVRHELPRSLDWKRLSRRSICFGRRDKWLRRVKSSALSFSSSTKMYPFEDGRIPNVSRTKTKAREEEDIASQRRRWIGVKEPRGPTLQKAHVQHPSS